MDVATAVTKQTPVRPRGAWQRYADRSASRIKARIDSEIIGVHFADGARVKQGDLLFTLDSRALEAQIRQAEGSLARDKAQLEGAERDVRRYTELVAKNATPVTNLDNAQDASRDVSRATIKANEALLENLNVQLSYCTIRAPITGRISVAAVKVGNFVRRADIRRSRPSSRPRRSTSPSRCRSVPARACAKRCRGNRDHRGGRPRRADSARAAQVTMIENTVDAPTGMVHGSRDHAERGRASLAGNAGERRG